MKTIKRNKNTALILITTGAILVLLVLMSIYYFYTLKGSFLGWSPIATSEARTTLDLNPPTADQLDNGQNIKNSSVLDEAEKPGSSGSDRPSDPQPQSNGKSIVDITITAANQNDTLLQVRTFIGSVQTSGICTLTLSNDSNNPITLTSGIQSIPSGSTCKGFDIPRSQLSPGKWHLHLTYENETLIGTSTKDVNLN